MYMYIYEHSTPCICSKLIRKRTIINKYYMYIFISYCILKQFNMNLNYINWDNTWSFYVSFIQSVGTHCWIRSQRVPTNRVVLTHHVGGLLQYRIPSETTTGSWISNHMTNKVWDEITYPFPNFNGAAVEVWEWMSNFITLHWPAITYPCRYGS